MWIVYDNLSLINLWILSSVMRMPQLFKTAMSLRAAPQLASQSVHQRLSVPISAVSTLVGRRGAWCCKIQFISETLFPKSFTSLHEIWHETPPLTFHHRRSPIPLNIHSKHPFHSTLTWNSTPLILPLSQKPCSPEKRHKRSGEA